MDLSNFLIQQIIILAISLSTDVTGTMPKPRNPPAPKLSYIESSFLQPEKLKIYSFYLNESTWQNSNL